MLFPMETDSKLPKSGASNNHMDVEKLFGVYGGVILSRRFVAGRVAAALAYLLLEFFVAGLSKPCPILLLYWRLM